MNIDKNRSYIRKIESLVKPQDVTAISFLGDFNRFLPKKTQHKIMKKGSRTIPYMGFIVDPYCFFLSYRIKDREAAQAMLPKDYELAETRVFEGENPYPMVIICAFSVRTSAFIGMRLEFYIIARNRKSGLLSWIIADYETNTNSHDPKNGFCGYTSDPAQLTTTPYGELLVDFKALKRDREYSVLVDLKDGKNRKLEKELWIEGNLSVDYGGELLDESSSPFSLIFDPVLMKEALEIPMKGVRVHKNSYLNRIIDPEDAQSAAVFPYSQHFVIRQDLKEGEIRKEEDILRQIDTFLEKKEFKTMSGDDIKKPLFRSMLLSSLLTYSLIIFLILKILL